MLSQCMLKFMLRHTIKLTYAYTHLGMQLRPLTHVHVYACNQLMCTHIHVYTYTIECMYMSMYSIALTYAHTR